MSNVNINDDVQRFQAAVKHLGSEINMAGVNWHDEKHAALSNKVGQIASNARGVMASADKLTSHFRQFESIAAQK